MLFWEHEGRASHSKPKRIQKHDSSTSTASEKQKCFEFYVRGHTGPGCSYISSEQSPPSNTRFNILWEKNFCLLTDKVIDFLHTKGRSLFDTPEANRLEHSISIEAEDEYQSLPTLEPTKTQYAERIRPRNKVSPFK